MTPRDIYTQMFEQSQSDQLLQMQLNQQAQLLQMQQQAQQQADFQRQMIEQRQTDITVNNAIASIEAQNQRLLGELWETNPEMAFQIQKGELEMIKAQNEGFLRGMRKGNQQQKIQ